jgi:hypothetical protein
MKRILTITARRDLLEAAELLRRSIASFERHRWPRRRLVAYLKAITVMLSKILDRDSKNRSLPIFPKRWQPMYLQSELIDIADDIEQQIQYLDLMLFKSNGQERATDIHLLTSDQQSPPTDLWSKLNDIADGTELLRDAVRICKENCD